MVAPASAHAQSAALQLIRPTGIAYDSAGNLFVADSGRNQIVEIGVGGAVTVVAGTGTQGFSGDGGPASAAQLNEPESVAVAANGTLYIADTGNQRIRAVEAGQITTFAGTGTRGFSGDGGSAIAATFDRPVALALEATGALLVCDQDNQRVRRIGAGQIATIAGKGVQGFAGDGAHATAAQLNEPSGIAVSPDGRLFIADTGNQRVRVVSAASIISTFAGTGTAGGSGDNNPATAAQLNRPAGLAFDAQNELFVVDQNNHRLRKVTSGGTITTIAGNGVQSMAADSSTAISSAQNSPVAVAISPFGWPVIADPADGTLRILFSDGRLYAPAGLSTRTAAVTISTSNAVYGAAQTFVSVSGNPAAPQGIVQIMDDAKPIASASLTRGAATIPLTTLSAGTHNLTATYAGDGLHASTSATASLVISPAQVIASATSATVSYGEPLPPLTGSISGVLPQDQNSVSAVFATSAPAAPVVGTYSISATLSGSASGNYIVSMATNSGSLTVAPAATVATLSPPSMAYESLPLQLSAHVASTTSGTPTGTVQFLDGTTVIATAPLNNGVAAAVELNPTSGGHTLSVLYSGDANFRASTSSNVTETVSALPDFTIAAPGSPQQTVIAGASAAYKLTVASTGAPFTGVVTLSASGLPPGGSASFSPPAVVPGASNVAVTMTIMTNATTAHREAAQPELALITVAMLSLIALRRRRVPRLVALLLFGGLFGLNGCGARIVPEAVSPVQSYPIQVQATGTNLAGNVVSHTARVTLAVQ